MNDKQTHTSRPSNPRRNDLGVERRERRLTIQQVALIVGISERAIQGLEEGSFMPSLVTALKLQILYRSQLASFYQPLYEQLVSEVRAAEECVLRRTRCR
jgi:DNA-binding XRE family transcriptional regulator